MSKKVLYSFPMFDAVSLSATKSSDVVNVQNLDNASIHIMWASGSSPVGDITVEVRNGEADDWRTLDFGSAISISGTSGEHEIVMYVMPFTDVRLKYTRTSGDATLSARITAKTVGA